jgi:hypothetical protein
MIPQIGSGLTRGGGASVVKVPPPLRFRPISGRPRNVQMKGCYETRLSGTPSQRGGVRYERKVQQWLLKAIPGYAPSRQFTFQDDLAHRCIIPDGYCLWSEKVVLFEIKIQHMPEAWWQLDQLYKPVVQEWCGAPHVVLVEVTRTYDPAVPFPCEVRVLRDHPALLNAINDPDDDRFLVFELRL